MSLGLPPSSFLTNRSTKKKWTKEDKKIAIAYTVLQNETCKSCGNPMWICHSDDSNIGFKVNTSMCYASAELESWQETNAGKNMGKGEKPVIKPYLYDGSTRFPGRSAWIEQEMEE